MPDSSRLRTTLRILRYLLPYKRNLTLASLSMSCFVLFNMATVVFIIPFINILFERTHPVSEPVPEFSFDTLKEWAMITMNNALAQYEAITALKYVCILIAVSFILKNLFQYLQSYFMAPAEQGIIRDLRRELYEHMNRLSLSYFSGEKKGALLSRIVHDVRLLNDSAIAVINSVFRDPPQVITYTAILFFIDWQMTLIVFVLLPATGIILARIAEWLKRESVKLQDALSDLTSVLDEGLSSMRIIKAFRTEQHETEKFGRHNQSYFRTYVRIARRNHLSSPLTEVVSVLVLVFILWFMGESILSGRSNMSSGVFVAYIFAMLQMMQPLKFFGQMIGALAQGLTGAERVFGVLDIQPRIVDRPDAVAVRAFKDCIRFEDVRFRYDEGDEVLRGVNAEIRAGEIVALVGPSGAGKSTMADLIPRFYDVTGGRITLDGIDLRGITVASLRDLMGIVTQETFLFNTTIRENVAYGRTDASMDAIIAAAKAANAHDFIIETPNGYDTIIGDRGVKLSGGQRQRLSIARAIFKNPPILILDEATSALDTESEILVQEAIEHLMEGRTSIVIAHRLSTIQRAHRIYVLDDGYVREWGTHEELLQKHDGLYRRLHELQFSI